MFKHLLCIALLPLFSQAALATGQAPDKLVYRGQTYDLFTNPLESFYEKGRARPAFRVSPEILSSSFNWRGYVATWEIAGGSLYLIRIDSWVCSLQEAIENKCRAADLKELFGEKHAGGRVHADWFSGEMIAPDGKLLEYVRMGYGSVYEREITFSVEGGKVMKTSVTDNRKRKRPSNPQLRRRELEKLEKSPAGKRKATR